MESLARIQITRMNQIFNKLKDFIAGGCWHEWTENTIPPYSYCQNTRTCIKCKERRKSVSYGYFDDSEYVYTIEEQQHDDANSDTYRL